MDRNIIKMIDLTQFMLMESIGDSEEKSDLNTGSFLKSHSGFFPKFDDDDNDNDDDKNDDDDDAESCSYGSSHEVYENVNQYHDDDGNGMSYYANYANHDDGMDDDDDDAINSKMVEVSKKCRAFTMGRRQDCSNTKVLNEKENDKNFWETCLAS